MNNNHEYCLSEYSSLRSEQLSCFERLTSTVTFLVSSLSVFFLLLFKIDIASLRGNTLVELAFYFIIPLTVVFVACVWFDLLYRAMRIGSYIYVMENKLKKQVTPKTNTAEVANKDANIPAQDNNQEFYPYWEHWLDIFDYGRPTVKSQSKIKNFFRTGAMMHYISIGVFIATPILSASVGMYVFGEITKLLWLFVIPVVLAAIFYFYYIKRILGYINQVREQ